jgi:hypothetical protein
MIAQELYTLRGRCGNADGNNVLVIAYYMLGFCADNFCTTPFGKWFYKQRVFLLRVRRNRKLEQ